MATQKHVAQLLQGVLAVHHNSLMMTYLLSTNPDGGLAVGNCGVGSRVENMRQTSPIVDLNAKTTFQRDHKRGADDASIHPIPRRLRNSHPAASPSLALLTMNSQIPIRMQKRLRRIAYLHPPKPVLR